LARDHLYGPVISPPAALSGSAAPGQLLSSSSGF
jgi:hypothetical protein